MPPHSGHLPLDARTSYPQPGHCPRAMRRMRRRRRSALVIAFARRVALDRTSSLLLISGVLLLAMAAGEPRWRRPAGGVVHVLVDLSASTRGATYRDRAVLDSRVHQLLGELPSKIS